MDTPGKATAQDGAGVIVDYLIREKVPYAFGLCGHGNIGFIDALYERSSEIKTVSVRHESVAGFMADVYYRVSGKPTATFTSCGPGSANLPIALANAFLRFGALSGGDRQRADNPVQPRRVSGNLPSLPGRFSLDGARLLQARVPAHPPGPGGAADAPGMEDDDDRTSGPGGARRTVRHLPHAGGGRDAAPRGVECQYFVPLRRRSRRRGESGGHADVGAAGR